ncbi:MAG: PDGLE domain-containing protein [Thermoplasmatota archaeon]
MDKRSLILAVGVILAAFAVGLVLFFIFSAPYGDGLEKTMDDAGVEEGEPVYSAPLDYGEDYFTAFAMGVLGFVVVLVSAYALGRVLRKKAG